MTWSLMVKIEKRSHLRTFQAHIKGCIAEQTFVCYAVYGIYLGMRLACLLVPAFANDLTIMNHYTANEWVGVCSAQT